MTIYNILWYFFIYAFLGWCLEVCFCSIQTGSFVNRGFLNGPVCPIYGFGMLIAGSSLAPVRDNLILLFFGGMVLASALELVGGWALKKLFHTTWWDYSDEPLNIGGYICLKFSLAWGVCVTFAVRVLHPAVAALVDHIPHVLGVVLCAVFCVLIVIDIAATVASILRLEKALGRISAVAARMREGSTPSPRASATKPSPWTAASTATARNSPRAWTFCAPRWPTAATARNCACCARSPYEESAPLRSA